MKHIILFVVSCLILAVSLTACEKPILSEEEKSVVQTEDNTPLPPSANTKKFTFTIKADFSNEWKEETNLSQSTNRAQRRTLGYLAADGKDMTDVWVLDYMGNTLVQQLHQADNTAEDFGKPVLNLDMGSHHIYFIASRSSNPTLNTTDKTITFSKVSDTFWKDYEVNVVSTSNGNRAVTLDRIVSMIKMTIDDAIKEGTTTFNITPHTWYYGFNYTTGNPVASATDQVISISCPSSNIGQTGRFLTAYTISSATEWTTDITIAATDGTNTIGTATIYDAPFKRNKWKPYHGPLFGTNGEMTIGLNSTWEVYEEGTW